MTKIHENFLPTISLITRPRNIRGKVLNFNEQILGPYLDKLGEIWNSKQHRRAVITNSVLKFETTHASIAKKSQKSFANIEAALRRFFTRWGYVGTFEYSELRGKCKLHVGYKFDSTRMPIIPLVEDPAALPQIKLKLGFVRLALTLGEKDVEINIATASGTEWKSMHTSRCLYSQVSDVRPLIRALMGIVNKEPYNFEVSSEHV